MTNINVSGLIETCDKVSRRCIKISDTYHGSVWLFDKLMRYFESETSVVSVVIPVFINTPIMAKGEAVIGRDGSLVLRTIK